MQMNSLTGKVAIMTGASNITIPRIIWTFRVSHARRTTGFFKDTHCVRRGGSMGITWRLATLVILLCALDMQALQRDSHTHLGSQLAVDPNWSELSSSMEKMHQAMASVAASGDGDVDFVRLMLPHHQAAIDMAKTQLLYGK